jgi:hypothetical protein
MLVLFPLLPTDAKIEDDKKRTQTVRPCRLDHEHTNIDVCKKKGKRCELLMKLHMRLRWMEEVAGKKERWYSKAFYLGDR